VWAVETPEPRTAALLGIALFGVSAYLWRNRRTIGRNENQGEDREVHG
jgi:predicted transcriptional regulator